MLKTSFLKKTAISTTAVERAAFNRIGKMTKEITTKGPKAHKQ